MQNYWNLYLSCKPKQLYGPVNYQNLQETSPCPFLFLDQTDAQRAENIFWEQPHPLSQGLDDRPNLYLKVWIRHCFVISFVYQWPAEFSTKCF